MMDELRNKIAALESRIQELEAANQHLNETLRRYQTTRDDGKELLTERTYRQAQNDYDRFG